MSDGRVGGAYVTEDVCVLVVDGERRLADAFSRAGGRNDETRTAYGGDEALDEFDDVARAFRAVPRG